jgi:hypothetical protein
LVKLHIRESCSKCSLIDKFWNFCWDCYRGRWSSKISVLKALAPMP